MSTQCYALVRGSAFRATALDFRGAVPEPVPFVTGNASAKVTLTEVSEGGGNEVLRNDTDEIRIFLPSPAETIKYTCDIDFLNCDPAVVELMTGNPAVHDAVDNLVGFDAMTRLPAQSFALEVWSKLAGQACQSEDIQGGFGVVPFGEGPFGVAPSPLSGGKLYGYTLFPWIKGGHITGFTFGNNLVSFALRGAQAIRGGRWDVGPHDLTGEAERLSPPVSRNTLFRQMVLRSNPPVPSCGLQTFSDVIDGGTPALTSEDIIDGGTPSTTTEDIIDGGTAA